MSEVVPAEPNAAEPSGGLTRGIFIVFEGGDGVGKSTQARRLAKWLQEQGYPTVLTFEPGGTQIGRTLRQLVLDPASGDVAPIAEALAYAADKAQHVYEVIEPALQRGEIVISDRYVDSMLAYQGAGRVLDVADVAFVARWATQGLRPDLTVLLDLDPDRGLATIENKDRLEGAGADLHERAREFFLQLADSDPDHYLVLPARTGIESIGDAVQARVETLLSAGPGRLAK